MSVAIGTLNRGLGGLSNNTLGFITSSYPGFSPGISIGTSGGTDKFGSIVALISQGLATFGKKPTAQIGANGQVIYTPVQTQTPVYTGGSQNQMSGGLGSQAVSTAGGFFDGIARSFGISPTMLALGGALGVYLLLREPPKRR